MLLKFELKYSRRSKENFMILLKKISTSYIGFWKKIFLLVSPRETSNFQENAITCYDRTRIAACKSRVYCRFPLRCYFLFLWTYHGDLSKTGWKSYIFVHGEIPTGVPIIIYNNWRLERNKNFSCPSRAPIAFNFSWNLSIWLERYITSLKNNIIHIYNSELLLFSYHGTKRISKVREINKNYIVYEITKAKELFLFEEKKIRILFKDVSTNESRNRWRILLLPARQRGSCGQSCVHEWSRDDNPS